MGDFIGRWLVRMFDATPECHYKAGTVHWAWKKRLYECAIYWHRRNILGMNQCLKIYNDFKVCNWEASTVEPILKTECLGGRSRFGAGRMSTIGHPELELWQGGQRESPSGTGIPDWKQREIQMKKYRCSSHCLASSHTLSGIQIQRWITEIAHASLFHGTTFYSSFVFFSSD